MKITLLAGSGLGTQTIESDSSDDQHNAALPVVTVTAEHHSEDLQKTPMAIFRVR